MEDVKAVFTKTRGSVLEVSISGPDTSLDEWINKFNEVFADYAPHVVTRDPYGAVLRRNRNAVRSS